MLSVNVPVGRQSVKEELRVFELFSKGKHPVGLTVGMEPVGALGNFQDQF